MIEWKEVWYVWGGVGAVPSGVISAVDDEHNVITDDVWLLMREYQLGMHCGYVSTYTLGEQRRRCQECFDGYHYIPIADGGSHEKHPCYCCNGTGWEYKERAE